MDLSRTKSLGSCRPVEDEDDDDDDDDECVVTHVVLRRGNTDVAAAAAAAATPRLNSVAAVGGGGELGLQGSESSSLASCLGVKKERAENGQLYVFLEVKEEEDDGDGSPAASEDENFQGDHAGESEKELYRFRCEDLNQDVAREEELLEAQSQQQQQKKKKKPVDLTPFLSFLSDCIKESRASDTSCTAAIIHDENSDGSGDGGGGGDEIETAWNLQLESFSYARMDSDSSHETTNVRSLGVSDNSRSSASGTPAEQFNPAVSFAPGTSCRIVDEEILAALAEDLSDGDVPATEPYPVPAESDVSSEAAAEDEEENVLEGDCHDGPQGNGLRGFEAGGFEVDHTFQETTEEQQVQCVGTDQELQQHGEHSPNLEQNVQGSSLAPAKTLTTSEDSESFRKRTSSEPETRRHATALTMVSDTDLSRLSEDLNAIDEAPSATATDHMVIMSSNQTSKEAAAAAAPETRNLLQAHNMFDSWYGMDIEKLNLRLSLGGGGGVQAFQSNKRFKTCLDSGFKPLRHCDSSPCSSQSHTPGLGISKGSEISYNPVRRSLDMKDHAKPAELVHRPDSSPCSSNYDTAAAAEEDARSNKCEEGLLNPDMGTGISTTTTTTTTQLHHHFKPSGASPNKCRSPRKVVMSLAPAFKYVESWKRLMPLNGKDPDKERQKVIWALYTFEELREHLREAEELRVAKGRAEGLTCLKRPDLKAATEMRLRGFQVNTNEYIGNVPGIYIGDRFWYRIEMVVIGLHKQLEAGIAFISKTKARWSASVATSIVMKHSGNPYRDDIDNGEFITYTGQGGLSARSSTAHSISDQVLTRGNEALKNSYEGHWPIRVIRGDKDKKSPTGEVYTYIGLYQILCMRYEPGKDGNLVYMFDLKRQGGQQPLPICAPEPKIPTSTGIRPMLTYVANTLAGSESKSITVKRKWDDLPNACDHLSTPSFSSRVQWGIPVDFPNTNQALYVRGS